MALDIYIQYGYFVGARIGRVLGVAVYATISRGCLISIGADRGA